jgi:hypothetical protein
VIVALYILSPEAAKKVFYKKAISWRSHLREVGTADPAYTWKNLEFKKVRHAPVLGQPIQPACQYRQS